MKRPDRVWIKLVESAITDVRGPSWKEERERIAGLYRMSPDAEAPDERDVEFRLLEIGRLHPDNAIRLAAVQRLAEEMEDRKREEQIVIGALVAHDRENPEGTVPVDDVVVRGQIGMEGANLASGEYREAARILKIVELTLQPEPQQTQQVPLPSPDPVWWTGTQENWKTLLAILQEHNHLKLRKGSKPLWKASAAFAGVIARAAQRKGWLRSYVGKDGYPSFMRRAFAQGSIT